MNTDVHIVFTARPNLLSRLIRWVTRSKVSHVFLEYSSEAWGGRWAAEAGAFGVRKIPANLARHYVVGEFSCRFETDQALQRVAHLVGERYDFGGILWLGWAIWLWRVFGKRIRKPLNNTKGQFCSEFVSRFLQVAQNLSAKKDPEVLKPNDLWNHCMSCTAVGEMARVDA